MAKKPEGCKVREVQIKRKGKKKPIATFMARSGRDCKPRTEEQRKKAIGQQGDFRKAFAKASKTCQKQESLFTKGFGSCMKDAVHAEQNKLGILPAVKKKSRKKR